MAYAGMTFCPTRHSDIYSPIDPTKSDLSQPGKIVLITGSGRGIGRSTALRYAESKVETIILCARTMSELDEVESAINTIDSSIKVDKHRLDVTDESNVQSIASKYTKLDVLVNNAGASEPWIPIADSKDSDWWRTMDINLRGPYLVTKHFLPALQKAFDTTGHADLINVSSVGAEAINKGASAYQISKLGLCRLTEFVQVENPDINCVSFHPGGVLTELSKGEPSIRPYLNDKPELAAGFVTWITKGERKWLGGRFLYANWDVDELLRKQDDIVARDLLKFKLTV